jgi:hypothetical protein
MANISRILITNTIDFGRTIVNQLSSTLNGMLAPTGFNFDGNVVINPANTTAVSLNVANGFIIANGFNLFSIPGTAVSLNAFRNSQLGNSSITVNATTGMNGGGTLSLGSTISVNIVPVDSFVNTRTNIALSANSLRGANSILASVAADANLVNTGVLSTAVGGTGRASFFIGGGQTLIGTTEGSLTTNTVRPGIGIAATYGPGSLGFSANLIQGTNTTVTSGHQVFINAPPVATTTTLGIARLDDTTSCTDLTIAATANAVNAVHSAALAKFSSTSQDQSGRLIEYSVYSTPGVYTWTKPANAGNIELIMIGAGGGGAGAGNGAGPTGTANANYCSGGFAGALIQVRFANSNVNSVCTITVGHAGNSSGSFRQGRVGYRGGNTIFSQNSGNTALDLYANGGNGGLTSVDSIAGSNLVTWFSMANSHTVNFATGRSVTPGAPQPDYFIMIPGAPPEPIIRLNKGNTIGSYGGSVPGWCLGGWTSYSVNTSITGGSTPTCYGPDGDSAAVAGNGSGFGGAGGGGAFNDTASPGSGTTYISGASGANGVVVIKVYT